MFTTSADEGHGKVVVIVGAREKAKKIVDPSYTIPSKRQKIGDVASKDDGDVDDDSEDDLDSQATIPCQDWEIKLHELVRKLSGGGQKIGDVDDDSEDDGDVDDVFAPVVHGKVLFPVFSLFGDSEIDISPNSDLPTFSDM